MSTDFIGFRCKDCRKPFFVIHNTPESDRDNADEIGKYEHEGFELEPINNHTVSTLGHWCSCKDVVNV